MRLTNAISHKVQRPVRAIALALALITPITDCPIARLDKFGQISAEDNARIENMLGIIEKIGATQTQENDFRKIAEVLAKDSRGYDIGDTPLDNLEKIVDIPFNLKMIAALKIVMEGTPKERRNYALKAVYTIKVNGDEQLKTLSEFEPMYKKTLDFMMGVGADHEDLVLCLNFAYALRTIGEDKTRELYRQLGIEYFARYSSALLLEVYENLDNQCSEKKPLLLAAFNKNDHNGAFYSRGMALSNSALFLHYRTIVIEAEDEEQFYMKVREIAKGDNKINVLVIAGHGQEDLIVLGGNNEKQTIDLSDSEELTKLKDNFVLDPTIILDSCSTGKDEDAIAGLMSRILDAKVFAPTLPSYSISYDLDGDLRIVNVTYGVRRNVFEFGVAMVE